VTLQQKQLYRALMNTIDFFSQRLHVEQIIHYGYKIFEDLTLPTSAAIYTINASGDLYIPSDRIGYEELPNVEFHDIHNEFARKNGFVLDSNELQKRYFKDAFIDDLKVELVLPLIIEDKLFGFIIAVENNKSTGIKNKEFLNRFNDLLNLSLEKAESFERSKEMKTEIRKRKFNLDSFSQTMDILMTALDQKYIIKMCLDVVRELTASSVTSIALEVRENHLTIAGYKDIVHQKECFLDLVIKDNAVADQVIYHVEDDYDLLCDIFSNPYELEQLEAEYVVFLVKETIIGCITIGAPVSEVAYDKQLLEQIKSLASMMYIAINNANQFKVLTEERNKMSEQIKGLKHLNRSIAIINGADSLEELCSHVKDTLTYGFGVENGFLWVNSGSQNCYKTIGMEDTGEPSEEVQKWLAIYKNVYIDYTIPDESPLTNESSNCLICIPILQRDYNETCMGYLVIDKLSVPLTEAMTIIFETLTNSISPVIKQFLAIETYEQDYVRRPESLLEELFDKYESEKVFFDLPYEVYARKRENQLFCKLSEHESLPSMDKVDVGCISIIFTTELLEDPSYRILQVKTFEDLKDALMAIDAE